jgi:pimeloyl-ACP methyl ester carboxylesterase
MGTIHPVALKLPLPQGTLAGRHWRLGVKADTRSACIALHGWLDNCASFDLMALELHQLLLEQGMGLQLYCLDLAGHGHSFHRPPAVTYNIWDYAIDVLRAAQRLDLEKFLLLGHSMGAGIAPLAAAMVPGQVTGLVLIEGLGPLISELDEVVPQLARLWQHEQQVARPARQYRNLEQAIATRMNGRWPLTRRAAELLVKRATRECNGGVCWRSDRRLTLPSPLRLQEPQVQRFLQAIVAPVDLVVASDGLAVDRELLIQRAHKVADIKVHQLVGSHHLHLDSAVKDCSLLVLRQLQLAIDGNQLPDQGKTVI